MVNIKSKKEIEIMRQGGKILAQIFSRLSAEIKPGIKTGHLEKMANFLIQEAGGRPSFKGYKSKYDEAAFPTALCASLNNEVVHGPALPSRELKSGDIVGLDLGMEYPYSRGKKGYYTDMAATIAVGKISKQAQKLINAAKNSLFLAIEQVRPGNSLNSIGKTIEQYIASQGFSVVRELVGHGVGLEVHEDLQIPNYDFPRNNKIILKPGLTLAIEPMVNAGDWHIKVGDNSFTILTTDENLSAHFEHTVLVTDSGHEILTDFNIYGK